MPIRPMVRGERRARMGSKEWVERLSSWVYRRDAVGVDRYVLDMVEGSIVENRTLIVDADPHEFTDGLVPYIHDGREFCAETPTEALARRPIRYERGGPTAEVPTMLVALCNECGKDCAKADVPLGLSFNQSGLSITKGDFALRSGGRSSQYHFCSKECLVRHVGKVAVDAVDAVSP